MLLRRFYHITSSNYSAKKLGIKLCKMINPSSKRKWHPTFSELNTMPSVKSLMKVNHEPGKRGIRRIAVLNKLFMKNITDIMSTGSVSIDIIGRGIEISNVKMSPDLNTVCVFWVCKGDARDEETESVLAKVAGPLRHELSTLRLMGEVPYIVFVKDKQEAKLVDLDRRLAKADYGEDYSPTDLGHLLKTEFCLNTSLSPEMKAKIKQLDDSIEDEEEPIPEMTHNVYDLDHHTILNRLLAAKKKSKDAWRNIDMDNNVISYRAPANKLEDIDRNKQKTDLAAFLQKRKIEQNKRYKEMRANQKLELDSYKNADDDRYEDDDDDYYDDDEADDNFVCSPVDQINSKSDTRTPH